MDNYHQRYDSSGQSRENKLHRKKGFVAGVVMGTSGSEDAERKPKFVSIESTITFSLVSYQRLFNSMRSEIFHACFAMVWQTTCNASFLMYR